MDNEKIAKILGELKNTHYRDQHAVMLLQQFVLEAAASIGLPDSVVENFENMMIQFRDQSGIQLAEAEKLAVRIESALSKVKEYHDSVIEQISTIGTKQTEIDNRLKKLETK